MSAIETGRPVIPLYIHTEAPSSRQQGAASKWWLHHSLESLSKDLNAIGGKLIMRVGDPASVLATMCKTTKADAVYVS
ncbi:deoxyribodipyrimidine photo-lyase, partial [Verrucomicrobia bacterium]|nr:deoxyribodipyrimidine photo-lyase [Verrucomicrobiota bacterium]